MGGRIRRYIKHYGVHTESEQRLRLRVLFSLEKLEHMHG